MKYMTVIASLDNRRKKLGLSCATVAELTGVSLRTVQRLFASEGMETSFSTVQAVAEVLGMNVKLEASREPSDLRRQQAGKKADRIIAMVQGTAALESQAVGADTLRELHQRTVNELLSGPNRRLWAR